jgi:hypothetical protein
MGSQQLLLIVLTMLLVGVALAIAISLFQANAVESSRNALIEDMLSLAGRAREYYSRPVRLGGGNRDFTNVTINILTARPENENGRYYVISTTKNELVLGGKGRIVVGSDTIEVQMSIDEATSIIKIIH